MAKDDSETHPRKGRRHTACGGLLAYNASHDAFFCKACDAWDSKPCGATDHNECFFDCMNRPERPSQTER